MEGKSNLVLTWMFDERDDERETGKTMDVNEKYLVLGDKIITLLDTPGHRDLVPVMISGASHCDYGILMVEAEKVAFEAGFEHGQTKEHLRLLNSIGVKGLIVAVNKMDTVEWREQDFKFVKESVSNYITEENLSNLGSQMYIPIAAVTGENLSKPVGAKAKWWTGGSMVDKFSTFLFDTRNP
jgi:translation elongation factor EF-1alpha